MRTEKEAGKNEDIKIAIVTVAVKTDEKKKQTKTSRPRLESRGG